MDGDQPSYDSSKIKAALKEANIEFSTIADYPRHGDSLRLLFIDQTTADKALKVLLAKCGTLALLRINLK